MATRRIEGIRHRVEVLFRVVVVRMLIVVVYHFRYGWVRGYDVVWLGPGVSGARDIETLVVLRFYAWLIPFSFVRKKRVIRFRFSGGMLESVMGGRTI